MKILLHGGHESGLENLTSDLNFWERIFKYSEESDGKLLLNFFSREREEGYKQNCKTQLQKINTNIEIAIADEAIFDKQLDEYQVIFFQGGYTRELIEKMSQFNENKLRDKYALAGSSAGANYFSKYGVLNNGDGVTEGLGFLAHTCIPHADVWDVKQCLKLAKQESDLPVLLLDENQTVEFEI